MRSMRKSLALLLALAMVLTTFAATTVSAQTFSDTQGHWAESLIGKWSDNGVINGYEDGTFRPDNNITRAELAKIIATAKNYTAEAEISFTDVAGDEWFVSDLKKCVAQSVIGGYEDGTFRPDEYITREEASTMFARAYNINATALLSFTDSADISPWAQNAVTALVGANVISGYEDGSFMPKNPITRAEVVKILDGADSAEVLFPQATSFTGGTNSVGTIGNLGGGSTNTGGGSSSGGGNVSNVRVTFNANGGTLSNGAETTTITLSSGSAIGVKAPDAAREGYTFVGWYTTKNAADNIDDSKKWSMTSKVSSSMTLFAGWYVDGDVNVTFELNGGTGDVSMQTVASGSVIAEPAAVPVRANYEFTGWYTDNTMRNAYDFSAPVRKHMTLYAGWALSGSYEGVEITMPNETDPEKNFKTGTITAIPPRAIAGETVKMIITAPEGFEIGGINSITYVGTVTDGDVTSEQTLSIEPSAIMYDAANNTCSFAVPANALGDIKVAPQFNKAMPTAPPTATPKPTDPPAKMPTYYFSSEAFASISTLPANTEVGGITATKDIVIDGSNKSFAPSGYSYSRRLKISKNSITFKVTGSCVITVDAAHASSSGDPRAYELIADGVSLGTYSCIANQTESASFGYIGNGATITLQPKDNINLYGIDVVYGDVALPTVAPATPAPTIDPNIKYNINVGTAANGTYSVSNGTTSSDKISTVEWRAEDYIPEGTENEAVVNSDEQPKYFLNGKDASDGTFIAYEPLVADSFTDASGKTYKFMRGTQNPTANPPFNDQNQPQNATLRIDTAKNGYMKLEIYIYTGKEFKLYDNVAQTYLESFTTSEVGVHTFIFSCEEAGSYYFWAKGSKIGLVSATYMSDSLQAKAGETITIKTTPAEGYKTNEILVTPETAITKVSDNEYTFKMPVGDVSVDATFISSTAKEYIATAAQPEHGTVELVKDVSAAADDALIDSSEKFLVADGGKWIVSSDGTVGSTAVSDTNDIGGNATEKIKLTDKAVQYVLDDAKAIKSGPFTLSYDFYDDNTADAGRSFRTYLDNAPHAVSGGQATEMGTDAAIFHMMDVGGKVFVTKTVADIAGKAEAGDQVGNLALEPSKWYRVVITGDLDENKVNVSYYLHGTDGTYNPDKISAEPYISSDVSFTDGRTLAIAEVKFMRTAAGNLYYDNIMLTNTAGIAKTLKVYNGETVKVVAKPDTGYELDKITVTQTDGTAVPVDGDSFVMPASDVDVVVTFVPAGSKPTPTPGASDPGTEPTTPPTDSTDPDKTTTWTYSADQDGCAANTELLPGLTTLFNDKADGKKYLTSDVNGSLSDGVASGTALKFVSPANGTISVTITGLGATKTVYIVEEGGSQDSPLAKYENTTTEKQNITISAVTEAGKTYYIYGAGTKACFQSAMFVAQ